METSTPTDHVCSALKRIDQCVRALDGLESTTECITERAITALEECTKALRDVTGCLVKALDATDHEHVTAGDRTPDDLGNVIHAFSKSQGRGPEANDLAKWLVDQMMGKKPTDA